MRCNHMNACATGQNTRQSVISQIPRGCPLSRRDSIISKSHPTAPYDPAIPPTHGEICRSWGRVRGCYLVADAAAPGCTAMACSSPGPADVRALHSFEVQRPRSPFRALRLSRASCSSNVGRRQEGRATVSREAEAWSGRYEATGLASALRRH
ncbi:hypothetical protein PYCCODRAFT_1266594 [Trametes coccinea BRFM310]|uniref:Uncharacterized protein n=1 Tax=Trametes coccinea (strain BRFM310) TaxID=1353009 RepID=A0A1Y2I632_TRAC3|nr:hypothetical protein PYCCODRAFT_1266594 [Trametes coccinea BRFM310]